MMLLKARELMKTQEGARSLFLYYLQNSLKLVYDFHTDEFTTTPVDDSNNRIKQAGFFYKDSKPR